MHELNFKFVVIVSFIYRFSLVALQDVIRVEALEKVLRYLYANVWNHNALLG